MSSSSSGTVFCGYKEYGCSGPPRDMNGVSGPRRSLAILVTLVICGYMAYGCDGAVGPLYGLGARLKEKRLDELAALSKPPVLACLRGTSSSVDSSFLMEAASDCRRGIEGYMVDVVSDSSWSWKGLS